MECDEQCGCEVEKVSKNCWFENGAAQGHVSPASMLHLSRVPDLFCVCHACSIEDVLQDMLSVGSAVGLEAESKVAVQKLQARVQAASSLASQLAPAKYGKVRAGRAHVGHARAGSSKVWRGAYR
eukprot:1161085-Pelagomonas_calceolata.AAC.2